MKSLTRKTSTSGRIGGFLVAAATLLLPAALLTQAEVAAAQLPDITVYHSLHPLGADPRSGTVPPGCDEVAGGGGGGGTGGSTVVVGDVNAGSNPTFYSNVLGAGTNVLAGRGRGMGVGAIIDHYNSLPGVTVTESNTTITSGSLAGVDLLIFNQVSTWNIALVYTAAELTAISEFLGNGGQLVLVVEISTTSLYPNANDFLTGIGSAIQFSGQRVGGPHAVITDAPFTTGVSTFAASAYNTFTGGTPIVAVVASGDPIVVSEVGGGGSPPVVECVLGGGSREELRLWIDGGTTPSGVSEVICSKDIVGGGESDGSIEGGNGHEICGAALTFQIQGIGRFSGAIEVPPESDAGMDTLVLGTECTPGEGLECTFPITPPVKLLTLNFRRGGVDPLAGARFMGSLIVDTTGLDLETNFSLISVFGQAAGAELQMRSIASGETPEVIADSRLVPEPGQLVQLLSGLFGLAGLNRLRRKR